MLDIRKSSRLGSKPYYTLSHSREEISSKAHELGGGDLKDIKELVGKLAAEIKTIQTLLDVE